MPLHLTKVAYGATSIDDMKRWFRTRGDEAFLTTRYAAINPDIDGVFSVASDDESDCASVHGDAIRVIQNPETLKALQEQATRLWHMSNLFKSPDGEKLAARLCEQSFAASVETAGGRPSTTSVWLIYVVGFSAGNVRFLACSVRS